MKHSDGFTLIELMIVVAILGILVVIATSALITFQAKAKQAEAKVNLEAIGTSALAYKVENNTYITDFTGLGWSANMITRYRYWYNGSNAINTPAAAQVGVDYSDPGSGASIQTFTAAAVGNIDSDSTSDIWLYNENRELRNTQNDPTTP